jgi:hypothetical protein
MAGTSSRELTRPSRTSVFVAQRSSKSVIDYFRVAGAGTFLVSAVEHWPEGTLLFGRRRRKGLVRQRARFTA